MNKKIISIILTLTILFAFPVCAFASSKTVQKEVDDNYKKALALADKTSFHGNCNLATAYQLLAMGIYRDGLDFSGAGDLWYGHFSGVSKTSGGYSVITVSGKNCLYDLTDKYGDEIYNVVYSLGTGGTSGSKHVLYIRAIIDGNVYFADSFGCTYGGAYYPEGKCTVLSVDKFVSSYKDMNGDAIGCVYFSSGEASHIRGSDTVLSQAYEPGRYKITASALRVREHAGTASDVLGLIMNGEITEVTEVSDSWGKITYNGSQGWICLDYAEMLEPLPQDYGGFRIAYISSDLSYAFSGDTITWNASAVGGDDSRYVYSFTVFKDDKELFSTPFDTKNSVSCEADGEGEYRALVCAVDRENNRAEAYSEATVSLGKKGDIILGDADLNGKITSADARLTLRTAAGLESLFGKALICADADGSGVITSSDARKIIRWSAGLE